MNGGAYLFQLMDFYSASGITILWCCFFQTIAIGWIFGARKFANCVEQMTGYKPNLYWVITWGVVAPLVMAVSQGYFMDASLIRTLTNYILGSKLIQACWNLNKVPQMRITIETTGETEAINKLCVTQPI
jgi:hypothetical protein